MKFRSENPEVVGQLEPSWAEVLPTDYSLQLGVVVEAQGNTPNLQDTLFLTRSEGWRVDTSSSTLPPQEAVQLPPLVASIVGLTDADYREVNQVDSEAATEHRLSIRSGVGTATSFMQAGWLSVFGRVSAEVFGDTPPRKLRKSSVHTDGRPKPGEEHMLLYTICQGVGTSFWEGEFRTSWLPGELGGFGLSSQVRGRQPTFTARNNEVLRMPRTTVHQAPGVIYDPQHPRRFVRDVVTLPRSKEER